MRLLLHWILSGLAVWIVAQVIPGFHVSGPFAALIAALGYRLRKCHDRPPAEDSHVSLNPRNAGSFLARDQCFDAGACRGTPRAEFSGAWIPCGLHRRNSPQLGQHAAESPGESRARRPALTRVRGGADALVRPDEQRSPAHSTKRAQRPTQSLTSLQPTKSI